MDWFFLQDCQHSLCSADFPTGGFTQTLSGFTKLRFVVPLELGVPKPFQDSQNFVL
jgi:hypothetical protein